MVTLFFFIIFNAMIIHYVRYINLYTMHDSNFCSSCGRPQGNCISCNNYYGVTTCELAVIHFTLVDIPRMVSLNNLKLTLVYNITLNKVKLKDLFKLCTSRK